jgi:hypothetical protein
MLHSPSALTHLWLDPQLFKHLHYLISPPPPALTNLQNNLSFPPPPRQPQAPTLLHFLQLHQYSRRHQYDHRHQYGRRHQYGHKHQYCCRPQDTNLFSENAIKNAKVT